MQKGPAVAIILVVIVVLGFYTWKMYKHFNPVPPARPPGTMQMQMMPGMMPGMTPLPPGTTPPAVTPAPAK